MPANERPSIATSGILNVAKPRGMTSHDVVGLIRRRSGVRRVGHAGTLDPEADGVLLVCLGQATRVSEYLMQSTKSYRATVRFGAVSTTDDRAGVITTCTTSVCHLTLDQLVRATSQFLGEIEQIPPAYAAIKIAGQPMYRFARAGHPVAGVARKVRIDRLDVRAWECPDLTLDVVCSKGTYVRALARDLGQAVGTGAYLLSLTRTASGSFSLDDSLTLDEVVRACTLGYLDRLLYPLDRAVSDWPALFLDSEAVTRLGQGQAWRGVAAVDGERARAYHADTGELVALVRYDGSTRSWQPEKVFREDAHDLP